MSKSDDPTATLPASLDSRRHQSRDEAAAASSSSSSSPSPRRSIPVPPPAPLNASVPKAGTVLGGKYRIERILGSGGIAVVAAAYHLQLRRRVAIKYLLVEALECPEIVERFTREARAAARIRGEHVARVIDVGTFDEGAPYIVLEYLEGMDLEAHLRKDGPLQIALAIRYILQTCEALAEAHAAKIVHRDLKPANLFLAKGPDRRTLIKVLDFGVSKILDEPMTEKARMLGTVVYMSPEQLHAANEVDLRTDIWSLGVILYELLAGVPPFKGQTIVSVAQQIEWNRPRPLSQLRADVPPALEAVIARCLRTDPAERYASVLELAVALSPFMAARDRESIRTITGVLQGSLAPPAYDSDSAHVPPAPLHLPPTPPPPVVTAATPVMAMVPPPMPAIPPPPIASGPPPIGSDAPITTSVDTAKHEALVPAVEPSASWLRSHAVWLVAAVLTIVAVILSVVAVAHGSPPTKAAKAAPAEVVVRITAKVPNARARIDDGPLLVVPAETSVPRDHQRHTIRVEAEGYAPWTTTVGFTDDVLVTATPTPRP